MNIHYFQHVPFEDLGSIETWVRTNNHKITSTQLFNEDSPPPMDKIDWLIVMGGPMNIYEEEKFSWLAWEKRFIGEAISAGKVVLGICLGAQLIADVLGAKIYRNHHAEIGWFPIEKSNEGTKDGILNSLPEKLEVYHWHGDTFELPPGSIHIARSEACENQAFVYDKRVIGFQFHLETTVQSAKDLIKHSSGEIVDGSYIQSADAMLADKRKFEKINKVMENILNELAQISG